VQEIDSKFRFILIAAKRARQLQGGARPMIAAGGRKFTRIAQEETRDGFVDFEIIPFVKSEIPVPISALEENGEKKVTD
jgi:DNA-directed RNA polymerase subunit omega